VKKVVILLVAIGVMLAPTTAHAEWFFTKAGAQRVAADYVSSHYADTYVSDLTTACRPQGKDQADPRYKYHRWVCGWYDDSDGTSGQVLVIGSSPRGSYYGQVMKGAASR
jgi:hypothetical protein